MGCRHFKTTSRSLPVLCLFAFLFLWSLNLVEGRSQAWLPGSYPNPIKFPEACGRGEAVGWICDPDNVLSKEDADSIARLLQDISAATNPYPQAFCMEQGHDGYPVSVALVKKLGTRFGRPMSIEAAHFADTLYNAWSMEYKSCRNGILLVVSTDDREAHIRVGDYITPVLNQPKLHNLAQRAKKQVALGDVYGAVRMTMHEAALSLNGYAKQPAPYNPARAWLLSLFFFGSAGVLFLCFYRLWQWMGKRRSRRTAL